MNLLRLNKVGIAAILENKLKGEKVGEMVERFCCGWDFHNSLITEGLIGSLEEGLCEEERAGLWNGLAGVNFPVKPWILAQSWIAPLKSSRSKYTWSNNQDGGDRVYSKIDHVFVNEDWIDSFPNTEADFQWEVISDHCFCLVKSHQLGNLGRKPFRFFNMWTHHSKFEETVL
ncbi:uncharacterized protein LOC133814406 [Humulus lupulus]|uniref:uncharacterized protein LOC133814406 n=1 Tax=Humulus lupulus TaxID=3486 RepID=UPI002B40590C|nr:uncharacterized protein LOC133814406 [Humulus lupulus]